MRHRIQQKIIKVIKNSKETLWVNRICYDFIPDKNKSYIVCDNCGKKAVEMIDRAYVFCNCCGYSKDTVF